MINQQKSLCLTPYSLKNSFLIGDRATDIEAGNKVKCRTIFLDKKYREKYPTKQEATFINLNEATKYILKSVKNVCTINKTKLKNIF